MRHERMGQGGSFFNGHAHRTQANPLVARRALPIAECFVR